MEENKGLNITPVNAAAMDPAALPGLVSSPPDEKEKEQDETETTDEKQESEADTEESGESEDSVAASDDDSDDSDEDEAGKDKAASADKDADKDTDKDADGDKAAEAEDSDDDRPVFEAADRRGSVTVDSTGVRFQLDDTEAEFTWSEIGAVEYKTSRFGRRLVLSVHDSRGICPAEVEAPDKATLKEWAAGLESALDTYFEESSS
ncbi:hypothetical protein [Streptomyces sp. B8F3]|uniref:hypothetical protein n=1 Tax=unclassified Streptomyces TaxID=2593676 RepID=UPI00325E3292